MDPDTLMDADAGSEAGSAQEPAQESAQESAQEMAAHAAALADAVERTLPGWVVRAVARRTRDARALAAARDAGELARAELAPQVRALLSADIDAQRTTPLALLRTAVRYPTAVLAGAGVPVAGRDAFAQRAFPDDVYDLTPATFADIDASLQEPGLVWGAAKAHVHLTRRRVRSPGSGSSAGGAAGPVP